MHNFLGHDGFVWWIGQVVSIDDPLTLGRCRVRIFGYHGEAKDIPDADLPWAVSIHPVNTPNLYGTPRVGDFVFGFFLDALAAQEPAMLGYFPYSNSEGKSFSTVTNKNDVVLDVDGNVTISAGDTLTIKDKNGQYTIASLTAAIAASGGGGGSIVVESGGSTIDLSSVTQSIIPSTDETYDLGSSTKKWRSLYVSSSTIYIGGNALSIGDGGALLVNGTEIETGVADGSITAAKIASGAVTADKIVNGSVGSTKIASSAITADKIASNAITAAKIADGTITNAKLSNDFTVSGSGIDFGTSAITLAKGTTAQRPESPEVGMFRFNTSTDGFEFYTANSEWLQINSLGITNVNPTTFTGEANTSFTITGTGFTEGCQVRFVTSGGTEVLAGTVAINSLTQITATTGRNFLASEEPLSIKVTNPAGISVTLSSVIDTGGSPSWANTAGSLGTVYAGTAISPIILLATDPDGQAITYEYTSGSPPSGITSTTSNEVITLSGTPADSGYNALGVTSNFEITASDAVGNQSVRAFSILKKWNDGSTAEAAATNALALVNYGITENGLYYINLGNGQGAQQVYCVLDTDYSGGGWMVWYGTPAGGTSQTYRVAADRQDIANSPLTSNYSLNYARRSGIRAICTETQSLVGRQHATSKLWLRLNNYIWNSTTHSSGNFNFENLMSAVSSTGATDASVDVGIVNTSNGGGGDFGIAVDTLDHHSSSYYNLNSGCSGQYLYQYGAGYKASSGFTGFNTTTSGCEQSDTNAFGFWIGMR